MQMVVTETAAYIVVKTSQQDMTTDGMIASSIIVGRALAPFGNAIGMWKSISPNISSNQLIYVTNSCAIKGYKRYIDRIIT